MCLHLQRFVRPLAVVLLAVACAGCRDTALPEPGRPVVVASIPPLAWLARSLAGDAAEVRALVPPGASVHTYEPTPADSTALSRAALIVEVGLGLEGPMSATAGRHGKTVRIVWAEAAGIGFDAAADHAHHAHHDHAPGEPCDDHAGPDAHLWLDPVLLHEFVHPLAEAMERAGIVGAVTRADGVRAEIDAVDAEYRRRLAPFTGRAIVTHHDAWIRLADRYGLRIARPVLPRNAAEASPADVAAAAEAIRSERVVGVFTEPQLDPRHARRLAEIGGVPLGTIDPLGDGDWPAMMRRNLDELVRVLAWADATHAPGAPE